MIEFCFYDNFFSHLLIQDTITRATVMSQFEVTRLYSIVQAAQFQSRSSCSNQSPANTVQEEVQLEGADLLGPAHFGNVVMLGQLVQVLVEIHDAFLVSLDRLLQHFIQRSLLLGFLEGDLGWCPGINLHGGS